MEFMFNGDDYRQKSTHPLAELWVFFSLVIATEPSVRPDAKVSPKTCSVQKGGSMYMGSRNITIGGKACQPWVENIPHKIPVEITDAMFPDGSKDAARNYCRNPGKQDKIGVWCYTMDADVEWEFCNICPNSFEGYNACELIDKGKHYKGVLAHSRSYQECQPWKDHPNEEFQFPDGSAENAKNYCRNPNPNDREGPWCYITGVAVANWDYCDVCKPFEGKITLETGSNLWADYKNPEMSRLACLSWCITMAHCLAAAVGTKDLQCFYKVKLGGLPEKEAKMEIYHIDRSCYQNIGAQKGYFVEAFGVQTKGTIPLSSGVSVKDCDEKCMASAGCVFYEYYVNNQECRMSGTLCCQQENSTDELIRTRMPLYCDAKLNPPADVVMAMKEDRSAWKTLQAEKKAKLAAEEAQRIKDEEARQAALKAEEDRKRKEEEAKQAAIKAEEDRKRKEEEAKQKAQEALDAEKAAAAAKRKAIIIIVIVLLIMASGGGGYVYYKFVYLKKKEKEAKASSGTVGDKEKDKAGIEGGGTVGDKNKEAIAGIEGGGTLGDNEEGEADDKGKDQGKLIGKVDGKVTDKGKVIGKVEDKGKDKGKVIGKVEGKGTVKGQDIVKGKDKFKAIAKGLKGGEKQQLIPKKPPASQITPKTKK